MCVAKRLVLAVMILLTVTSCSTPSSPPEDLYKVVSVDDWQTSQGRENLVLSDMDRSFIHLSTEEQLDKVIAKYWKGKSAFVVIRLKSDMLPGRLVLEKNPGGSNVYYHLYEGAIPMDSVVEHQLRIAP